MSTPLTRREALALGGLGLLAVGVGTGCSGDDTGDASGPDASDGSAGGTGSTAGTPTTIAYGEHPSQVADLYLTDASPDGAPTVVDGRRPLVVLVHGGFWQSGYDRRLMEPLVADLLPRGWPVLNLEYRTLGEQGGGWPGTFDDVAAGVDLVTQAPEARAAGLDPARTLVVGHSAGGQLALWAAARGALPSDAPGADPQVVPAGVVGQAAVCDLARAAREDVGAGAVPELLGGGPDEVPARYALASPQQRLPLGVPTLVVHGRADAQVPLDQSVGYERAARAAGDDVELVTTDEDHFAHLTPTSAAWRATLDWLEAHQAAG